MTHASLFSGIGGFDLAAEWAGWTNMFNCEIDGFCRKVLKYHFPNAQQYADIRTTDFTVWRGRIDVLTGGFPCQPFSLAGKRRGTEDDRYLWPEMLRAIREIRPEWVVGENVYGFVNWSKGLVFEQVCADLENEGTPYSRLYFRLAPSMPRIAGTECGLLPTAMTQGLKIHGKNGSEPIAITMLPTPNASEAEKYAVTFNPHSQMGRGLTAMAMNNLLPTPTASDYQSPGKHGTGAPDLRTTVLSKTGKNSRLSPLFVAEMMGFPPDWTALPFQPGAGNPLKPMEMP